MTSLTTTATASVWLSAAVLIACGLLIVAAVFVLLRSVLDAAVKRATEDSIDG